MGKAIATMSRWAVLALLPACAAPVLGPLPQAGVPRAQTAATAPVSALRVSRVLRVPAAVDQAYAAAMKDTVASYEAEPDISGVTVTPLRPTFRLAQRDSAPVYIMAGMGNMKGKLDKDIVATAFSVGFAFDENGQDTGFGSSCFVDSIASTARKAPAKRLRAQPITPWNFRYMSAVPGGLNVALDRLHNKQMDELQAMFAGQHLKPLKATPGPGRIVAIRHKEQTVGYIESLSSVMWDKDPMQNKGVEVVNVFDPTGVLIESEGRYLDPVTGNNHKLFQFER
jgi:hypothetical protein